MPEKITYTKEREKHIKVDTQTLPAAPDPLGSHFSGGKAVKKSKRQNALQRAWGSGRTRAGMQVRSCDRLVSGLLSCLLRAWPCCRHSV